jgi:hypothetical protein
MIKEKKWMGIKHQASASREEDGITRPSATQRRIFSNASELH